MTGNIRLRRLRLIPTRTRFLQLKNLMIVGIDCYHDFSAGKRSIGALVASLNQTMSRWGLSEGAPRFPPLLPSGADLPALLP